MPHWKAKIGIGDLHQSYQDGLIDVVTLAESTHNRLSKISYYRDDFEFQEIVDWFKDVSEEATTGGATINDYDNVLRELYDWADCDHRLWIDAT